MLGGEVSERKLAERFAAGVTTYERRTRQRPDGPVQARTPLQVRICQAQGETAAAAVFCGISVLLRVAQRLCKAPSDAEDNEGAVKGTAREEIRLLVAGKMHIACLAALHPSCTRTTLGNMAPSISAHTSTQRCSAADCTTASSTAWDFKPSKKLGVTRCRVRTP